MTLHNFRWCVPCANGACLAVLGYLFALPPAPAVAQPPAPLAAEDAWEETGQRIREAFEQFWIPKSRLTNGPQVRAAFRPVVAEATRATVEVRVGGKAVALGGVVGPDGWILTKASELGESITCRLSDGRELDARIVGVSRPHDLAMLKVAAKRLPALRLDAATVPQVGQWAAAPGTDDDPVAVGVVSVGPRAIARQMGLLGIQLEDTEGGVRVVRVFADSGAEVAGILVNDIVVSVNGRATPTREALIRQVRRYSPGDELELGLRRGGDARKLRATLTGGVSDMYLSRGQYQNSLGGELSRRRSDFPAAFQHDAPLRPIDCGGPLVDLDGRVIGFNIARAGRTESYAVLTRVVAGLLVDLMSGKLAPKPDTESRSLSSPPSVARSGAPRLATLSLRRGVRYRETQGRWLVRRFDDRSDQLLVKGRLE